MAKTTDMTTGTPIKHILLFAVPMFIGNIFQQLYNFVDMTIVGRYVGESALAAVGTTHSANMFMVTFVIGMTNGAGIIMSQCFGANKHDDFKKTVRGLMTIAGIGVILISALGFILAPFIMRALNTPDDIIGSSVVYMRIMFLGLIGMITYNASAAILRSLGNSRTPLIMLMVSSVMNIGLDLLFVMRFGMGVAGAAAATVMSQITSAVLCIIYIFRHRDQLCLEWLPKHAEKEVMAKIIRTGIPSTLQSSAISLGNMSVQRLINSFGSAAMAAYTAGVKVDSLTIQIIVSTGMALSVFSGQNMGADKVDRIRKGLRQLLAFLIPVAVVLACVILIFRRSIVSLFLDPSVSGEAISIACDYLGIIGVGYIVAAVMQSFLNVIRGAGDVNVSMIAGFSELGARIAGSYILVNFLGIHGIWLAVPFSWMMGCMIPLIRYFSGKWIKKKLV